MKILGPAHTVRNDAERILRTLPDWFGVEDDLMKYAEDTKRYPTFAAIHSDQVVGFITLRPHFSHAWELHCLAVDAAMRRQRVGASLHAHAQQYLADQGAMFLQVKTVASSYPSDAYAQTRAFYEALGYHPLEIFTNFWREGLDVCQLIKLIGH